MKYKQLIKNELCKIQPHGDFKTRNEAELRIFKRWLKCAGDRAFEATVNRQTYND